MSIHGLSKSSCMTSIIGRVWVRFILPTLLICSVMQTALGQSLTVTADPLELPMGGVAYAMAVQPDGKVLLGGDFSGLGEGGGWLARLNADGSVDAGFTPGIMGFVYTLAVQTNGEILVGGCLKPNNTTGTQVCLVRLHADGTLDTDFADCGADATVRALLEQADGKILVGGDFTNVSVGPRNYLARLNSDGTVDTTFVPEADGPIYSLAMQTDGQVLVGGAFGCFGGESHTNLARLSVGGTVDSGFLADTDGQVNALALQTDGGILVGGSFGSLGGVPRSNLGRLDAAGHVDTAFVPEPQGAVCALALQADAKILIGGGFTKQEGEVPDYLARLNADGSVDTNFFAEAFEQVFSLALQADGKILASGNFEQVGGTNRYHFARLNNTEAATGALSYNESTLTLTWLRGGTAPEVQGTTFESTADGIHWALLGAGTRSSGGWALDGVAVTSGTVRARGYTVGGQGNASAGMVEASLGAPLIETPPVTCSIRTARAATFSATVLGSEPLFYQWRKGGVNLTDNEHVAGATSAELVIGGTTGADAGGYDVIVSNVYGQVTSAVAALTVWDPFIDGQPETASVKLGDEATFEVSAVGTDLTYQWRKNGVALAVGTGASLTVASVTAADIGDYDVVVSGTYGCATSKVAVLEVNLALFDSGFKASGSYGADGEVYALAVQPNGKILVSGNFNILGNSAAHGLGRLNADGIQDHSFNSYYLNGTVNALTVLTNGQILVGGSFSYEPIEGESRNNLVRLNEDGSLDAQFTAEPNGSVLAMAVQADGRIVVGGDFTQIGGGSCTNLARLNAEGTLENGFGDGADGEVTTLALQPGGGILVGGSFQNLCGESFAYLGRLGDAGTLDTNFCPWVRGPVQSLAVQTNGQILVGGYDLERLNADGSTDLNFNPGADGDVQSIIMQADGKILVSGGFTMLGGRTRMHLARLNPDGSPDTRFIPDALGVTSEFGWVHALALQADGGILVGGDFTELSGVKRLKRIARLFNTAPASDTLSYADQAVTWQRGGSAPEFWRTTFEYTTDGTSWTLLGAGIRGDGGWTWGPVSVAFKTIRARGFTIGGYQNGSGGMVEELLGAPDIKVQPASCASNAGALTKFSVLAVGSTPIWYQWRKDGVTLADGMGISGATTATMSLLGVDGTAAGGYDVVISNLYGCVTSTVANVTVQDPFINEQPSSPVGQLGGTVVIKFDAAGAALSYQWRKDGVDVPEASAAFLTLTNVLAESAGFYDVVVRSAYGCVTSDVAELEINLATADPNFNPSADSVVYALAVQPDGKIVVGGYFTSMCGETRHRIARLNANGSLDPDFAPDVEGSYDVAVNSLAVQADGKIVVGGYFDTLAGKPHSCFGRLNASGTIDSNFVAIANNQVGAQLVQADGRIVVGGDFKKVNNTYQPHLARVNGVNGTLDTHFSPSVDGGVYALAEQPDGMILAGGSFKGVNGYDRQFIARIDANGSVDASYDPHANGMVLALAVQADGKVLVGGYFDTMGTNVSCQGLARLNADGSVDTNFNPNADGSVGSIAVQADGKILVSGGFSMIGGKARRGLARLNADGSLDAGFNPFSYNLGALALQADGNVVVGGFFTDVCGAPHTNIVRLINPEPAASVLTQSVEAVTWMRGGSTPEVLRTTFEYTTNGTEWVSLGQGVRISDSWQPDGLPPNPAIIRARGFMTYGIVEAVIGALPTVADTDGDGIPDWWTTQYFGHASGQSNDLSRASDDASGTGQNNLFKYVAGLDPTNAASVFRLSIEAVSGEPTQKRVVFSPCLSNRIYDVLFRTNLLDSSSWTNVTDAATYDGGMERKVTDQGATENSKFYRIRITAP